MLKQISVTASATLALLGSALLPSSAGAATPKGTTPTQTAALVALGVVRDATAIATSYYRPTTPADVAKAVSETGAPIQISENLGSITSNPRIVRFVVQVAPTSVLATCVWLPKTINGTPASANCPTEFTLTGPLDQAAPATAAMAANLAIEFSTANNEAVSAGTVQVTASALNSTLFTYPAIPKPKNFHWIHVFGNLGTLSNPNMVLYAIRTSANAFSVQCDVLPTGLGGTATPTSCPTS